MEIEKNNVAWLDEDHPNYNRWKRSREISLQRGEFVKTIIENEVPCSGLKILDLGSGEGGSSASLASDNKVVSFDINKMRLLRQNQHSKDFLKILGDASSLPFKDKLFDLIIMQDVIEHLPSAEKTFTEVKRILKTGGLIYLSTPNKFSLFNIVADPHWGFPFVSLMNRDQQKKYFLPIFRKSEINRNDTAQLISLKMLCKIFSNDFELSLKTEEVVNELLKGNKGIIWSAFHIKLLSFVKKLNLVKAISSMVNNRQGFVNNFFTPTFYFVLKKN
jgi:ubiquinone/menaquinone biosynthesis C-methylase UbiE